MILKNTKKTIILNAGHWDDPDTPHIEDSGASWNHVKEAIEVMKIRDRVVYFLIKAGFEVLIVPDNLDLRKSIAWANEKAPNLNDALAIDIHLNFLSDNNARGSEAFFGVSETSKQIAAAISKGVSSEMNIPDRGAKPDTQTAVGELGWIRKTTMWASLIEVCFLTNAEDMAILQGEKGYDISAMGIVKGVCDVFGVEYPTYDDEVVSESNDDSETEIIIRENGVEKHYQCVLIK